MSRATVFAFDQPYPFTAVSDQPDAACVECSNEFKYPSSELVAIKMHKARRPDGHWLIYCREHFAEWTPTDSASEAEAERAELAAKKAAKAKKAKAAKAAPAEGTDAAEADSTAAPKAAPARRSAPKPKPDPVPERAPVMCPNDFVEVSMTGVCPMCGERVAG